MGRTTAATQPAPEQPPGGRGRFGTRATTSAACGGWGTYARTRHNHSSRRAPAFETAGDCGHCIAEQVHETGHMRRLGLDEMGHSCVRAAQEALRAGDRYSMATAAAALRQRWRRTRIGQLCDLVIQACHLTREQLIQLAKPHLIAQ